MQLQFDDNENLSIKRFERMLKTNNVFFFDSTEFERIIEYYIDNGKVHLAKKAIELAINQHPTTVGLKILQAEILIIDEKFTEAEKLLNELEVIEPDNEEIYIQKALLVSKQHRHSEAIELLLKALDISQDNQNIDVLSLIGMEYLYLENFNLAIEYFKDCLAIEPEDDPALYNIIYCYEMLENFVEGITFLNHYIENNPYNETAWHHLGRLYFIEGNFYEAIKAFDYAILIDEEFVGAYLEKAKTLEELHQYREAIKNYLITTQLDDPMAFAYLRIGVCYEKLMLVDEAIKYYLKASEQDPYLDRPILNIIELMFKEQKFEKAIYYINQLINIDEENPDYWLLYGKANMKIAFFSEAVKAFEKSKQLKTNYLEIYLELSDAYYFLGELRKAMAVMLEADNYYHSYADIQYRMSGLYFLLNSSDLAFKYLQLAFQKSPSKLKGFQKLFPIVYNQKSVQRFIEELKHRH